MCVCVFAMLMLVKLETFGDTVACIVVYFYSLLIKPIQRRKRKKSERIPFTCQSNDIDDVEAIYSVPHANTHQSMVQYASLRFNAFD